MEQPIAKSPAASGKDVRNKISQNLATVEETTDDGERLNSC